MNACVFGKLEQDNDTRINLFAGEKNVNEFRRGL